MYTNWLAQNSLNSITGLITSDDINIADSFVRNGLGMVGNLIQGNIIGGAGNVWNEFTSYSYALLEQKQHRMIPASVNGQLNSADVNVASGKNTFHYYKMSIKYEYAKIIDDYFSCYGYRVNSVKIPNIVGRRNWNFVKLAGANIEGTEIPEFELNEYKKQLEYGITFWHNPLTFRDYSQNNSIV